MTTTSPNKPSSLLRDDLSAVIGQRLPQDPRMWLEVILELDKSGRIQQRELIRIIVAIAERVAEYEQYA